MLFQGESPSLFKVNTRQCTLPSVFGSTGGSRCKKLKRRPHADYWRAVLACAQRDASSPTPPRGDTPKGFIVHLLKAGAVILDGPGHVPRGRGHSSPLCRAGSPCQCGSREGRQAGSRKGSRPVRITLPPYRSGSERDDSAASRLRRDPYRKADPCRTIWC